MINQFCLDICGHDMDFCRLIDALEKMENQHKIEALYQLKAGDTIKIVRIKGPVLSNALEISRFELY